MTHPQERAENAASTGRPPVPDQRPDPAAASGPVAFVAALRRLKDGSGLSYRELESRAHRHGDVLPRSTLVSALSRDKLPRADLVAALTRACGCPAEVTAEWLQLHRRARQVPAAADPPGDSWAPVRRPPVPRQLPADIAGFVGRAGELAELDSRLSDGPRTAPTPVLISAIAGTAGVGKTALAIHWAHRVADRFPDGQLYVNLRGFDPGRPPMQTSEAIRGLLDALEVPPQLLPASLDAQAARYRSLLADRRMLVVLDNARDAEQVRPLLPGAAGCLVVVTSRNQLTSLVAAEGAHPLTLDLLTHQEAYELLERRLGADRLGTEPDAVHEVITRCARLPVALTIVAAHLATYVDRRVGEVVQELHHTYASLDALSDPDPAVDVRATFEVSYRTLTADAARLFRLFGLHPGPEISTPAAASLLGIPTARVRRPLAELARAHLISEPTRDRYRCHDLLRAYAAELTHRHDSAPARRAATGRMLDFYLHTAYSATRLTNPHRTPITLSPPDPGVVPEDLTGPAAQSWLTREYPVLRAGITLAVTAGFDAHAWQLAWSISEFLQLRGEWHEWRNTQTTALAAARRLADPLAQALSHRLIAGASIFLRSYEDAHLHLMHALEHHQASGDRKWQARVHIDLSVVLADQGRYPEGIAHAERAAHLCQGEGDQVGHASALNGIGWMYAQLGDYRRALTYCEQALALQQEVGERLRQGATWDSLGYIRHHLGHHREAIGCYRRALAVVRESQDRHLEATVLTHLGDTHLAAGDSAAAGKAWRDALAILEVLDHPDAEQVRAKLHAHPSATP